jgi:hypothetical protein
VNEEQEVLDKLMKAAKEEPAEVIGDHIGVYGSPSCDYRGEAFRN